MPTLHRYARKRSPIPAPWAPETTIADGWCLDSTFDTAQRVTIEQASGISGDGTVVFPTGPVPTLKPPAIKPDRR